MSQLGTATAYGDVGARINAQAVAEVLANADYETFITNFAKPFTFKRNMGTVIRFRRIKPFTITTQPLTEGVAPSPTQFEQEFVDFRIRQYGAIYKITDWIVDLHEDPILSDIAREAAKAANRTRELILWGFLRAGTQLIYAGGEASRDLVATPINIDAISAAVNLLERNFAKEVTDRIKAGPNIATEPVGKGYRGFGHVDQRFDFEEMDTFVPVYRYGDQGMASGGAYEIGAVRGSIRVHLAPHLEYFPDSGAALSGAGAGMRSDTGTLANVYPFVIVAKDSYATIPFKGSDVIDVSVRSAKMGTPGDDLGQNAVVAWKLWYTGGILNQRWVVRIESTASELVAVA